MKKLFLLGWILLAVFAAAAQQVNILKEKNQLFIRHTVQAKESLYSLGRCYHLHPRVIASANQLQPDAGLVIGQQLKIPLTADNFIQSAARKSREFQPLYHTVRAGENLYQLSKAYNNVKQELLRKWNSLEGNIVKDGQAVVVGYMKYTPPRTVEAGESEEKTVAVASQQTGQPGMETGVPKKNTAAAPPPARDVEMIQASDSGANAGFFAKNFAVNAAGLRQISLTGAAATFKSTSGWTDKKYYVLASNIPQETIVKITANGRSVYARVLEQLPDLRENSGLLCRISNAAASALGITDAKFNVALSYPE